MKEQTKNVETNLFFIVLFPKRSYMLNDILIPSSPSHLTTLLTTAEISPKEIHSFHTDHSSAFDLANGLLKLSVFESLGIIEDI